MLTRLSTVALATGAIVTLGVAPAFAGGGPGCGNLCVVLGGNHSHPGRPSGGGTGGGGGGGGGGGKAAPIPCPGAVNCNAVGAGNAAPAPLQNIPPYQVAETARAMLGLPVPELHTSPEGKTYVRLKTGLWLQNVSDQTLSASTDPIDGKVATAWAKPKDITWNMGEKSVTCTTPGSVGSTACSYTYQRSSAGQPGAKYAISATITWDIWWTCEGACDGQNQGEFPDPTEARTGNTTLTVGEVQTESRPG
jgi:hypothetical protein